MIDHFDKRKIEDTRLTTLEKHAIVYDCIGVDLTLRFFCSFSLAEREKNNVLSRFLCSVMKGW